MCLNTVFKIIRSPSESCKQMNAAICILESDANVKFLCTLANVLIKPLRALAAG